MQVKEAIKIMVPAFTKLEDEKECCKDVVNATFETYENAGGTISKKILAKIAKAIATSKYEDLSEENKELADVLADCPSWISICNDENDEND